MFTALLKNLKENRRTIVFTEGPDARIQEAAARLMKEDLMNVILVGNAEEVKAAAEKNGFDVSGAEVIDPKTYAGMDEMVAKMVELRKGKMSEDDCWAAPPTPPPTPSVRPSSSSRPSPARTWSPPASS